MSRDDILEIETRKQELKAEASRAAVMTTEEAMKNGQTRKQERSDQGWLR